MIEPVLVTGAFTVINQSLKPRYLPLEVLLQGCQRSILRTGGAEPAATRGAQQGL